MAGSAENLDSLNGRVIIHVDMDCFYAQVEHRRLEIPLSQPLAVQQWEGLIAVNYAARSKGVTRFMRIQECILMLSVSFRLFDWSRISRMQK